jgi:putative tryptophan/tyrosine transport system substrate-binding protein
LLAFRQGLRETGYIEGQNLAIEYRWAEGRNDLLPALAVELVQLSLSVIFALGSTPAALAAKAATAKIPIVFFVGADPIRLGLVASLAHPGGNVTGVTALNEELVAKRIELAHEAIPKATSIALLVNPTNPKLAQAAIEDASMVTRDLGLRLGVLQASSERDFDSIFAALPRSKVDALIIAPDSLFITQSERLGALALGRRVPTIFQYRRFAAAGGLMSYGTPIETYSLAGVYAGRILKGEYPANLPVQQVTRIELIINVKAANALNITLPLSLLGRADEIIE